MHQNQRSKDLPGSATLGLAARAKALAAKGRPVLSMAVGEPDFNAPLAARKAAALALEGGQVRYTPAAGLASLRQTIASHVSATRKIPVGPEHVVVGHSCKHVLSSALSILIEPGDEVLLFAPAWNSYEAQINHSGGKTIWVPCREDLGPDFDAVRGALSTQTKGLVLNSPANPSGYVWSDDEIRELGRIAEQLDLWILSDEIYRRLVFDKGTSLSPVSLSESIAARTVIVDGASKSFAMTGYRIGYAIAPADMVEAISRLQSQMTGCPNYISQVALEAVLREEPPEVATMLAEFETRRDLLIPGLREMGLTVENPGGAFYAFPRVQEHLLGRSVEEFCAGLLEEENLAVVPGNVFGMPTHIRLGFALAEDDLREALARLHRFIG